MAERNEKEKTQAHTRTHTSSFLQAISSTRTITNITPKLSFYTFMADPFCFQKEEKIYLFTEFFDYRTRHGIIECLTFNKQMTLLERRSFLPPELDNSGTVSAGTWGYVIFTLRRT